MAAAVRPLAEVELPGPAACVGFAGDGLAVSVACGAVVALLGVPDLAPVRASGVLPHGTTTTARAGAGGGGGGGEGGGGASRASKSLSPPPLFRGAPSPYPSCFAAPSAAAALSHSSSSSSSSSPSSPSLGAAASLCVTCLDWAPDPNRPALAAVADESGTLHLLACGGGGGVGGGGRAGTCDLEEWARHMSVAHHAGVGLRQALHGTLQGVRNRGRELRGIATGAKEGISQALAEAKFIAKDLKESPVVQGLLGFFRK